MVNRPDLEPGKRLGNKDKLEGEAAQSTVLNEEERARLIRILKQAFGDMADGNPDVPVPDATTEVPSALTQEGILLQPLKVCKIGAKLLQWLSKQDEWWLRPKILHAAQSVIPGTVF